MSEPDQTPIADEWINERFRLWLLSVENKSEQMAMAYHIFGKRGREVIERLTGQPPLPDVKFT